MNFKKNTLRILLLPVFIGGLTVTALPSFADDRGEIERLKSLIEELDQRVKILDRKQEIATEEAVAKQKNAVVVNASEKGFGLKSADGQFEYKLRGLVQLDYRAFGGDAYPNAVNGFLARRIRPTFEGTIFGIYGFRFTPEFGESGDGTTATNKARVVDAYLDARLDPSFQIRAGKFKPFVGLERLQSANDIKFIERSYVSNNILPNRDLGFSVQGDVLNKKLNYAVGIYNGITDGSESSTAQDINTGKDYTARLFATPFDGDGSALAGLGFGLAATTGNTNGNALPTYKTPGQANNFFSYASNVTSNGQRTRLSPQANYYNGPFGLLTEYAYSKQDAIKTGASAITLKNDAWHVTGSWLLTGETASFKGVKPFSPFKSGGDGGWGALEVVARYEANHIDNSIPVAYRGSSYALDAKSWALGLNWYLNEDAKFALNYERTTLEGGTLDNKKEDLLVARYQLAF
jgi:phosphate-selective porin OprO/OprP